MYTELQVVIVIVRLPVQLAHRGRGWYVNPLNPVCTKHDSECNSCQNPLLRNGYRRPSSGPLRRVRYFRQLLCALSGLAKRSRHDTVIYAFIRNGSHAHPANILGGRDRRHDKQFSCYPIHACNMKMSF